MKKQLELDLNRFKADSPERKTFEQIQQYLLSLDSSNLVKLDLKIAVFEGIAPAFGSLETQPVLNVNGTVYEVRGITETPPTGVFSFNRFLPMTSYLGGSLIHGISYDFSLKDSEIRLTNPTSVNLKYRVVVYYR